MRRFILAAAALVALTAAVSLGGNRAEAMTMPSPLTGIAQQTEEVRLVCTTRRIGHRMVRDCRQVRSHYHRPHARPHHGHRHHGHRHHGHRR